MTSPKSHDKISFHVIFNKIVFKNKGHLKYFMNLLISSQNLSKDKNQTIFEAFNNID